LIWFGLGAPNGFVRQFAAQLLQPLEFLDGTAVVPLGLRLVAQEQGPTRGGFGHAVEAFGKGVVTVLGAGDLDIISEFFGEHEDGVAGGVEGFTEAGDEEAGLETRGAKECLLGERDAFNGEEFLGVNGLVDGEEVGAEMVDFVELFEADDGKGGGRESVAAGVACGAGFAFRGARAGGPGSVGAIGRELLFGDGSAWHKFETPASEVARGKAMTGRTGR
jgi:hypothetical protein